LKLAYWGSVDNFFGIQYSAVLRHVVS